MIKPEYKNSDLTERIIGAALKVHQLMRNGYPEWVYSKCLAIEFEHLGIPFKKEIETTIFYDGIKVGKRRMDFLIDEKVVVEIKAQTALNDAHLAQGLNYLEVLNLETGILLNFGAKSLQIKRIINSKTISA